LFFPKKINHLKKFTDRLCAGLQAIVRGMFEQMLAAATTTSETAPWAPPPGRSTAARSPMGWTRAPARGRAAAPASSIEPPWVFSSLFIAILKLFGGEMGEGEVKEKLLRF
jgi:hypothetical protein